MRVREPAFLPSQTRFQVLVCHPAALPVLTGRGDPNSSWRSTPSLAWASSPQSLRVSKSPNRSIPFTSANPLHLSACFTLEHNQPRGQRSHYLTHSGRPPPPGPVDLTPPRRTPRIAAKSGAPGFQSLTSLCRPKLPGCLVLFCHLPSSISLPFCFVSFLDVLWASDLPSSYLTPLLATREIE
jgi:hypothetical protein